MSHQECNDELDDKGRKCPLNSFKPCIGDACAFFLATSSILFPATESEEERKVDGNIFSIACGELTCAIRLTGFTSAMNYFGLKFKPTV